ncbi:hypothetical protein AYK26_07410 [Euryarchaeota archaeon SM23-78]|nr:MAG: hypothetical protein AYK26_07410 [Euryarchaeota archaeon SM23-78]MBW3001287.1 hypothetical protein [Candidatus Woesearchaeota archaeon]
MIRKTKIKKPTQEEIKKCQQGIEKTGLLDAQGREIFKDHDGAYIALEETVPTTQTGLLDAVDIGVVEKDLVWEPKQEEKKQKKRIDLGKIVKYAAAGLATAAIATMAIMPPKAYAADDKDTLSGDVEYIITKDKADHYLRPNLFYTLPGDIQGFTFIELYKGGGYYGRTTLDKMIKGDIGLTGQIIHASHPGSEFGLGLTAIIPHLPKSMFGKVAVRPLWIDKQGKLVDKLMTDYFVDITLPKGFKISTFGGWDLRAKGGPQWDYGEIFIGKEFGKVKIGYCGALINDGDALPDLQHRIAVGLKL